LRGAFESCTFKAKKALKVQDYLKLCTFLGSDTSPELNFSVYPDVLAVAETPKYWDKNEVLLINPLLIIEVLSRSTRTYDRTDKFKEYKTLPSFQEYLAHPPFGWKHIGTEDT
jgi:Uma2 family endonuclease